MQAFQSTNPLSFLSQQRMDQIISATLSGDPVVRTWPEYWRDFLTNCIHCCHAPGVTNQDLIDTLSDLISAQKNLNSYRAHTLSGPEDHGCQCSLREAYLDAANLASIANSEANNYKISVIPEDTAGFDEAFRTNREISICIRQKNSNGVIFSLSRSMSDVHQTKPIYKMESNVIEKNKSTKKISVWVIDDDSRCETLWHTL